MSATTNHTARTGVATWSNGAAGKRKQKNHKSTRLGVESGSDGARTFLWFGYGAPLGATLKTPTKLRLYTDESWGGASVTITVKLLSQRKTFSKIDDTNLPTTSGSGVSVTKTSSGDGDEWEFDVATLLQPVADGSAWYGFEVTSSSSTRRFFRSFRAGRKLPSLEMTWADEPSKPTTLAPSGGIAVSLEKPTLEMDYTDPTGGVLTAARVLVSASDTMSSPFDSGEVTVPAGRKARVDLAATAYAGLALDGTAYWQGYVKDESEVWSEVSNVASFTRKAKGTLVVDSPSTGTPEVTDYTPTVLATYTPPAGAALEKARVTVTRVSNGKVVYDSEEFPVTGTTIDALVADEDGDAVLLRDVTYEVTVYAWDDVDRVDTAADPAAVIATQTFTVEPGPTPAPTNLSAQLVTSPPGMTLTFECSEAPDSLTFTVDGIPVETNVEAADAHVSGTTYEWTVTRFRPNVLQTFGVAAVNDDPDYGASPLAEVNYLPRVPGYWLIDRDRGRWLFFANTSGAGFTLSESSSVLKAVGASAGVRVTQALGGYEDTFEGELVGLPDFDRTLQQWVDEFYAMRAEPGKRRILMGGTESFDVTVGYMNVRPTGDTSPNRRPVSFDYEQVSAQRVEVAL